MLGCSGPPYCLRKRQAVHPLWAESGSDRLTSTSKRILGHSGALQVVFLGIVWADPRGDFRRPWRRTALDPFQVGICQPIGLLVNGGIPVGKVCGLRPSSRLFEFCRSFRDMQHATPHQLTTLHSFDGRRKVVIASCMRCSTDRKLFGSMWLCLACCMFPHLGQVWVWRLAGVPGCGRVWPRGCADQAGFCPFGAPIVLILTVLRPNGAVLAVVEVTRVGEIARVVWGMPVVGVVPVLMVMCTRVQ